MSGMDRLTELLPCPFCGGEAELVHIEEGENAGGSCACCTQCRASGNVEFGFKENYISAWNRRASQAALAPQKPVAWAETDHKGKVIGVSMNQYPWHPTPLYAQAAPAPSDGLREAVEAERERIAVALEAEADLLPCAEDAAVTRSNAALIRADFSYEDADRAEVEAASVACPCTYIEQDESCPVGYPSLLCGICSGDGSTRQEKVTQLAAEMIRIASDLGEPEDPFAAWESVAALRERAEAAERTIANLHAVEKQTRDKANALFHMNGKLCADYDEACTERDAARRAEAAAWNDAIEAAARILIAEAESCAGLKAEFRMSSVPLETVQKWLWSYVEQCRALRRAAPTEGEA